MLYKKLHYKDFTLTVKKDGDKFIGICYKLCLYASTCTKDTFEEVAEDFLAEAEMYYTDKIKKLKKKIETSNSELERINNLSGFVRVEELNDTSI